jgi:hypothetical protein
MVRVSNFNAVGDYLSSISSSSSVIAHDFVDRFRKDFRFQTHVVPLICTSCCSAMTMNYTMHMFQKIALIARVSSATPLFGPVLGLSSTAIASVLAGQMSLLISDMTLTRAGGKKHFSTTNNNNNNFRDVFSFSNNNNNNNKQKKRRKGGTLETSWEAEETSFDAVFGSVLFFAASLGTFSRAMPSDVSEVGANAVKSIKAQGSNYATQSEKSFLHAFMQKYGCHHCGKKTLVVIGDHMPPNKTAFGSGASAAASRGSNVSIARKFYNFIRMVPSQRFYPQCESCSGLQSVAVRTGMKTLVSHSAHAKCAILIGAILGIRHFQPRVGDRLNKTIEQISNNLVLKR